VSVLRELVSCINSEMRPFVAKSIPAGEIIMKISGPK
jgi:hypothetical protein